LALLLGVDWVQASIPTINRDRDFGALALARLLCFGAEKSSTALFS